MLSKKRKGDMPENAAAEAAQDSSRNVELSSRPAGASNPDAHDDGTDEESDYATMRVQRDEARAKLAASELRNEILEAAASEPCVRCNFYSDWTVRVRTMSGHVHTIACPDGPKTLVAHVKQKLAQFDPKCHILQQVALVLPCQATSSNSSSSSDSPVATDPALAADRTLASYGVSKRDVLDLLLVDMNWNRECRRIIEFIKEGGENVNFTPEMPLSNEDLALAVSWALVNSVRLLRLSLSKLSIRDKILGYVSSAQSRFFQLWCLIYLLSCYYFVSCADQSRLDSAAV